MRSKKRHLSERGLILEYDNRIDPDVCGRVRLMASAIREKQMAGILNLVPTYRSLLIEYDPLTVSLDALTTDIDALEEALADEDPPEGRYFELPTYYGAPYDFDTERIAEHNGITPQEVVEVFSTTTLLVYFIGFIAALPYIGNLPESLHTPRLPTPRVKLPAGVVGVGGQQVAYPPVELPSGFNYFGRCFYKAYDPDRFPPTPFMAGDRVRFKAVSIEEAEACEGLFPEPIG